MSQIFRICSQQLGLSFSVNISLLTLIARGPLLSDLGSFVYGSERELFLRTFLDVVHIVGNGCLLCQDGTSDLKLPVNDL